VPVLAAGLVIPALRRKLTNRRASKSKLFK
jgi:hypothetical protein